jgi:uncharacterized protein YfaQ (DUF2300 family)
MDPNAMIRQFLITPQGGGVVAQRGEISEDQLRRYWALTGEFARANEAKALTQTPDIPNADSAVS